MVKITPWQIVTTRWKSPSLHQNFPFLGSCIFYLSITSCRNNLHTFLRFQCELGFSLTVPKIKCTWRCFILTWKCWIWISENESILRITAWKNVDYSSIQNCVWACHLVSVRKIMASSMDKCKRMIKYTLTSQQFWKLTNNGLKWFNFKMHVTVCLSVIKH